ncbi:hypothetical protein BC2230_70408 [Burkholderia cepacia]
MARMHRNLVAAFDDAAHRVDVGEIEARIDALRVEVQRERDEIDVAGTLAVAEQATLDAVGAREQRKFGRRDRRAAVVVRMHGQHDAVAIREVAVHPFDLVGEHVRARGFDGGRQVDDHLVVAGRAPGLRDRVADLARERQLGHAEGFRRVLEGPLRVGARGGVLLDDARAVDRERLHVGLRHPEHDAAERRADRVVQVHDRARHALERVERACDQVFARLHEHFDRHVVGNPLVVDQLADEIEVGLRRRRKADFDLLEPDRDQHLEEFELLLDAHRLDQRLVAVAQVGAHPDGRALDGARRPFAAIEADGLERTVLVLRIALHLLDLGSQVASEDGRHGRRLALPRSAARERAADADDLRESADG